MPNPKSVISIPDDKPLKPKTLGNSPQRTLLVNTEGDSIAYIEGGRVIVFERDGSFAIHVVLFTMNDANWVPAKIGTAVTIQA